MLPARFNEFDREAERAHRKSAPMRDAFFRFAGDCRRAFLRASVSGKSELVVYGEAGAPADLALAEGVARSNEETAARTCCGTYDALLKAVSDLHLPTRRGVPRNSARAS